VTTAVFVIHGINQGSADVQSFKGNLENNVKALLTLYQMSGNFTFDATFDYGYCAKNPLNNPNCSIANGADLLAKTVLPSCKSGINVAIVAYSMGGLMARDMIANNRQNVGSLCRISTLITLGTPNLGYPGSSLDLTLGPLIGVSPYEMNEMTSDFRNQVPQQ